MPFTLQDILEQYNESKSSLKLVLFEDAVEHLTRVHRILRSDRGHALLIGADGSWTQALTKLAAFTADCEVVRPITVMLRLYLAFETTR